MRASRFPPRTLPRPFRGPHDQGLSPSSTTPHEPPRKAGLEFRGRNPQGLPRAVRTPRRPTSWAELGPAFPESACAARSSSDRPASRSPIPRTPPTRPEIGGPHTVLARKLTASPFSVPPDHRPVPGSTGPRREFRALSWKLPLYLSPAPAPFGPCNTVCGARLTCPVNKRPTSTMVYSHIPLSDKPFMVPSHRPRSGHGNTSRMAPNSWVFGAGLLEDQHRGLSLIKANSPLVWGLPTFLGAAPLLNAEGQPSDRSSTPWRGVLAGRDVARYRRREPPPQTLAEALAVNGPSSMLIRPGGRPSCSAAFRVIMSKCQSGAPTFGPRSRAPSGAVLMASLARRASAVPPVSASGGNLARRRIADAPGPPYEVRAATFQPDRSSLGSQLRAPRSRLARRRPLACSAYEKFHPRRRPVR